MVTDFGSLLALLAITFLTIVSFLVTRTGRRLARILSIVSILALLAILARETIGASPERPDFFMSWLIVAVLIISFLRVLIGSNGKDYLISQNSRTAWHVALLIIAWIAISLGFSFFAKTTGWLVIWAVIVSAVYLSIKMSFWFRSMLKKQPPPAITSAELPSLTVAIPARNEDAVLESSLNSLLENDYEKLEVIVLDDCSQDGTSQIIQSFARRGVRFIQGRALPNGQFGKNWAYQQLLDETNSDYVLFMGADIHLSRGALRKMIAIMLDRQLMMLAVMPQYQMDGQPRSPLEHIQQVARYFWQMMVAGFIGSQPPTGGSCWLVSRQWLTDRGGFKSNGHTIQPERSLAKIARGSKAFLYLHSTSLSEESVRSSKRGFEQAWHMIRVAYPSMHRDIVLTMLAVILIVLIYLLPLGYFVMMVCGIAGQTAWSYALALSGSGIWIAYLMLHQLTSPRSLILAPLTAFIIPLYVCVMMIWSMLKYEFSSVQWKGRSLCLPAINFPLEPTAKRS